MYVATIFDTVRLVHHQSNKSTSSRSMCLQLRFEISAEQHQLICTLNDRSFLIHVTFDTFGTVRRYLVFHQGDERRNNNRYSFTTTRLDC